VLTVEMNHDGTTSTTRKLWMAIARAVWCFAIVAVANGRADAELPREIRFVTYNIHHGEGLDKKFDLARISKVVMAAKPDIVALQEVDQGTKRASGVDQPAEFERLMGMKVVFGRNIPYDGGGYGTAVLTNLPIRSHHSVKLKPFYKDTPTHKEQRGVQVLELGRKGEEGLLFLCTHLDFREPDDERMNSAGTINDLIRKRGGELAIIAGDFNALPDSRPIREFAKVWKIAGWSRDGTESQVRGERRGDVAKTQAGGDVGEKGADAILTFPADKPDHCIDYVMCRPAGRWKVMELRALDEPVASDHRPVLAVLRRLD
jgi:endonuclease/exonuclease/phosphatase family metal-dependent hydrolase